MSEVLSSILPDPKPLTLHATPYTLARNQGIYKRRGKYEGAECWQQFLSCHRKSTESSMAKFLNGVSAAQKVVGKSKYGMPTGQPLPLKGLDVNCKPNLILFPVSIAKSSKDLDWRDIIIFGEIKSKMASDTLKKSYIKAAGKTTLLLYAQDGRHSAPCL
ncbi:hypothetical protein OG21DRAFT_1524747 [Imleria badia]|nr:hypothetical protein OG21DRAFT_1524747 [Imleria badia]